MYKVLLEAVEKLLLFPGVEVMSVLGERDCLQTRHISAIESDEAGEYAATWAVLEELGLEELATATDCRVVRLVWLLFQHQIGRYIARMLSNRACTLTRWFFYFKSCRYIAECIGIRAATLAAAGVASLLNKMNRRYSHLYTLIYSCIHLYTYIYKSAEQDEQEV